MPIATPEVYAEMLDRAKSGEFAYPAINVTSSETLNAALRGFAEAESDGIIQISTGGAEFASGTKVKDMVTGATAMAEFAHVVAAKYPVNIALHTDHCPKEKLDGFVRPLLQISQERVNRGENPLFQSHMWDGSAIELHENLQIAQELLEQAVKAKIILELEVGVVGGEEDGISNDINEKLYTAPGDFEHTIDALGAGEKGRYLLAATFGNVHGVYKPGNVKLRPEILKKGQEAIEAGERDAQKVIGIITESLKSEPLARIDYVEVVDFENIQRTARIEGEVLVAIAVYIGKTSLIDNFIVSYTGLKGDICNVSSYRSVDVYVIAGKGDLITCS